MYKSILFGLVLISLMNCKAQKEATAQNTDNVKSESPLNTNSEIIYFNEGENKFIKEFQTNITFKNIAEDSRCPQGTQCIWAGVAVANVEFMSTTSRPVILQLSTSEVSGKNYHKTQSFNGYNITLQEVTPYPTSQEGTKSLSGKYKIGILISKENDQQNSTTR
ncbi:hypothetical protein [Chryseobacterium sp. RLHN22]|uniref:hypothetical protein n=1 Tax=Chryseobacterium sp. RLHN22 TaxID=3437885 RepID=UPI003D9AF42C